jgi:hypothetical protein
VTAVRRARIVLLLLLLLALAAAVAPAARADEGWLDLGAVSPLGDRAMTPQLAVGPDGTRVVGWIDLASFGAPLSVSVRVARPGEDFGPVQSFPGFSFSLKIATGADGTIGLGWWTDGAIRLARIAPGTATVTAADPLQPPAPERASGDISLGVQGGAVYAAYSSAGRTGTTTVSSVRAAWLPPGATAVAALGGVDTGGTLAHEGQPDGAEQITYGGPRLAIAGATVSVAWAEGREGLGADHARTDIRLAQAHTGGTAFAAVATLDTQLGGLYTGEPASPPDTATAIAAGGGQTYVAWQRPTGPVVARLGGAVTAIAALPPVPDRTSLRVAVDGTGAADVIWAVATPGASPGRSLLAARVTPGGTAGAVQALTPAGVDRALDDVAVGADGRAIVLARRPGDLTTQLFALRRAPGGAGFAPAESVAPPLSENFQRPIYADVVTLGPDGTELAAWTAEDPVAGPDVERVHVGRRGVLPAPAPESAAGPGAPASPARGSGAAPAPGPAPAPDRTAPRITALAAAPARFRAGAGATSLLAAATPAPAGRVAAPRTGTALRLAVSEPASLVVAVRRLAGARRTLRGTLVRTRASGTVRLAFSGRIGHSLLPAGHYELTVTAVDAAGNRSAARTVRVTLVGR